MYSVKESTTSDDHAAQLAVWARNFPGAQMYRRYEWCYRNNPFGAASYLLSDDNAQPIGAVGLSARRFLINNDGRLVGLCSDFSVDSGRRFLQPALQLQRAVRKNGLARYPFIYGFPNDLAEGVMARVGYRILGGLRKYTHRLRADNPKGISWMTDIGIQVWLNVAGIFPPSMALQELHEVDSRFDVLWNHAYKGRFMAVRDAAFLSWRFLRHPVERFTLYGLLDDGKVLRGYAVVRVDGVSNWSVVDFLVEDKPRLLPALMLSLARHARARGANTLSLEFLGVAHVRRILRLLGFRPESGRRQMVIIVSDAERADEASMLAQSNWYITSADQD